MMSVLKCLCFVFVMENRDFSLWRFYNDTKADQLNIFLNFSILPILTYCFSCSIPFCVIMYTGNQSLDELWYNTNPLFAGYSAICALDVFKFELLSLTPQDQKWFDTKELVKLAWFSHSNSLLEETLAATGPIACSTSVSLMSTFLPFIKLISHR